MTQTLWPLFLSVAMMGFSHALLPGHGKATAAALASHPRIGLWHLLFFCSVFTLIHSVNILALVFGFQISIVKLMRPEYIANFQGIAGLLVVLAGVLMLLRAWRGRSHVLGSCGCAEGQDIKNSDRLTLGETFLAALGYGLIPSAIVILPLLNVWQSQGWLAGTVVLSGFTLGVAAGPFVVGLIVWASARGLFKGTGLGLEKWQSRWTPRFVWISAAAVLMTGFLQLWPFLQKKSVVFANQLQ